MKDDRVYIDHILHSIGRIETYAEGVDQYAFSQNFILQDAVVRQLEIIGEATKRVSAAYRRDHPEVPWADMAGMRDILIHDYLEVDYDIVWKTVTESIPELKRLISGLL